MIKKYIRRIVLGPKADSEFYLSFLIKKGVQIGKNVRFFSPRTTHMDVTFPWLISIGDNVSIAHGVVILAHDYSWSVMKRYPDYDGEILGAMSPVKIGSNVFIGANATITRGVAIGDNVIIGAGSVVTSNCECDSVYAGNPARKIMTLSEFYERRKRKQLVEAKVLARTYVEKHGHRPPHEIFWEYFMLFTTAEEARQVHAFCKQMKTGGNFDATFSHMQKNPPMFDGFDSFLKACLEEEEPSSKR